MEYTQILDFLKRLPLFSTASETTLTSALCSRGARIQTAEVGEKIEIRGQKHLGILLSGRAQIRSTDGERTVILRSIRAGEVFGAASLFLKQAPPLSRIEALESSKVLFFDLDAVRTMMREDDAFLDAYLTFLAGKVQFLNQKIRCFTAGSAERRVALWLTTEEQERILLPDSLSALSDTLDIGRASLYRALDKLEADGLIQRHGREITLLSRDAILKKYQ